MNTLKQAKRDFQVGFLTVFRIDSVVGGGWSVYLGTGNAAGWLVDARSHQPRVFKTLDAAVVALREIGFAVEVLRM